MGLDLCVGQVSGADASRCNGTTEVIIKTILASGAGAANAANNRVYIADQLTHAVLVIDGTSNQVLGSIPIPGTFGVGEVAVNSSTGILYVPATSGSASSLFVINDNVAQTTQQLSLTLVGTGS